MRGLCCSEVGSGVLGVGGGMTLKQQLEGMQKENESFNQEHTRTEQNIKDFKEGMKRKSWRRR